MHLILAPSETRIEFSDGRSITYRASPIMIEQSLRDQREFFRAIADLDAGKDISATRRAHPEWFE